MVVLSVTDVKVTRGGRKPLLVELTSNLADASGELVPMPVCANEACQKMKKKIIGMYLII
jgi:O-succinylbenzoate synthase